MNRTLSHIIELLLLPPGNLLLFLVLALLFYKWRAATLIVLVIALLQTTLFSLPRVSDKLFNSLSNQYPPTPTLWLQSPLPQAIVVLSAGRSSTVEYEANMSSSTEMERLNYAAHLHRKTGLPILLSGGGTPKSDAEQMQQILQNTFNVPARWIENRSRNTWENAAYTDQILTEAGIKSAWVVTQAWHMPRTMYAFQNRQVAYLPASTTYNANMSKRYYGMKWIPQANALVRSNIALREWVGLLWYQLRQRLALLRA